MKINQFDIWLADLNPQIGTESGKTRPVLIIQTDLLNRAQHPSTIICPLTTQIVKGSTLLRVHFEKGVANLSEPSDAMIDQIRAIDNTRLIKKIGTVPATIQRKLSDNLRIILDLDS
jgi:mRNA interferase MazF